MSEPHAVTPTSTEDVPATPGWVEQSFDDILSDPLLALPQRPSLLGLRNAYLDCLAGAGRTSDLDESHDRCRRTLLLDLAEQEGVPPDRLAVLEQRLEALEAAISAQV